MTRTRWEYLVVVLDVNRRKITPEHDEYARLPDAIKAQWQAEGWSFYWWREHKAYISRVGVPGMEEVTIWEEHQAQSEKLGEIIATLGQEGWEMYSVIADETAMTEVENRGWTPTGFPIRKWFHFKRPME